MDREALEQLVERLDEAELALLERVVRGACGGRLEEELAKLTDRALALSARKGFFRKEAFAEWMVQRQGPWLKRYFLGKARDPLAAEELTYEVFFKVFGHLDAYDPNRELGPWLKTIAYRAWVDWCRRRRGRGDLGGMEEVLVDGGPAPEVEAEGNEAGERIRAAVEGLPERQREVLSAWIETPDHDTVAQRLGLEKKTVYQRLFRARRQVQAVLGRFGC